MKSILLLLGVLAPAYSCGLGYTYCAQIVIDHTQTGAVDTSNFVLLTNDSDSHWASGANGGVIQNTVAQGGGGAAINVPADAVFSTDSGCASKLNWEFESYNASTGARNVWIRIPSLSYTADTIIFECLGNSQVTTWQGNVHGTWDTTYEAVWHLPSLPVLSLADSTSNGNNAAPSGSPQAIAGQIDGAIAFIAPGYAAVPNSSSLNNWSYQTISFWIQPQAGMNSYARFLEKGANTEWTIGRAGNSVFAAAIGSGVPCADSTTNLFDGPWHKIDITLDYNTGAEQIYIDGILDTSSVCAVSPSSRNYDLGLGAYFGGPGGASSPGNMDEIRISNIIRSSSQLLAEYNNQKSGSTFYRVAPIASSTSSSIRRRIL